MGKCWKCNRQGPFLAIGPKSGLCIDCLEEACEIATSTLEKLSKGGQARAQVLDQIDTITATDVAEKAMAEAKDSAFSKWDVSVHSTTDQLNRIRRSASVKIISYESDTQTAVVAGSGKSTYSTSFSACTCGDFISRRLPCKHMYRLAALYGGVDFSKHLK